MQDSHSEPGWSLAPAIMNPESFGNDITGPKGASEVSESSNVINNVSPSINLLPSSRVRTVDGQVQPLAITATDTLESSASFLPMARLSSRLESLEMEYQNRVKSIRRETAEEKHLITEKLETEKQILLVELYAQEDLRLMKAKEDFAKKRKDVLSGVLASQTCSSCKTNHKYLSAICIECKAIMICDNCLQMEIAHECKCSNCDTVTNIICPLCQAEKLRNVGWLAFDSCRAGCGFLCPQHRTILHCQSCGSQSFCDGPNRQCQLHQCSKCKIILCTSCRKDDGCICTSSFNLFDDSAWRTVQQSSRSSSSDVLQSLSMRQDDNDESCGSSSSDS